MSLFLQVVISFSLAQKPQWLQAKSASELVHILEQEQKQKTLYERCRVELQQNWLPRFCFEMLEKTPMPQPQKFRLEKKFRRQCTLVVQKMRQKGESADWIFKNSQYLLSKCDASLQELYKDFFYQKERQKHWQIFCNDQEVCDELSLKKTMTMK